MSAYILPYCVTPTYLQETEYKAAKCGLSIGLVYAIVINVIILVFSMREYFTSKNPKFYKNMIIVCIVIMGVLPIWYYYGYKNMWNGYNDLKADLKNRGLSENEIIRYISSIYSTTGLFSGVPIGGGIAFREHQKDSNEKK